MAPPPDRPDPQHTAPPADPHAADAPRSRGEASKAGIDPAPPVYVASDLHLGAAPPRQVEAFHHWLDRIAGHARHLVLNGDLFDFWYEYRSVIPRGATRTLGRLAAMVDAGIRIDFVGGNHDWWGGSYLRDEVGLRVHHDPVILELGRRRCLLAHGDGLGRGDLGYRALRLLLRSRPTQWAFRWLHPDVGARLAALVSRTELREGPPPPRVLARSEALERWARETLLADESLDAVLLGHTHLPRRVEMAPDRYYLNSGDWLQHGSWLELEEGAPPRLMVWNGGTPLPFSRVASRPAGDASPRATISARATSDGATPG